MTPRQTPAGAMPVVESATLSQSYPFGPWFAPYRVPRPGFTGVVDPRAVGIVFEGEPAGDAGAGAGGATPSAAGSSGDGDGKAGSGNADGKSGAPAAGGDDKPLGEGGIRALENERAARRAAEDKAKAAEKELEGLRAASKSEAEKALDEAKKAGGAEVLARLHGVVRQSAVTTAMLAAGVPAGLVADLSNAPEFAKLKVGDDDKIDPEELKKAVAAHKTRVPDAYKPAGGSADGGARDGNKRATSLEDAIANHYG